MFLADDDLFIHDTRRKATYSQNHGRGVALKPSTCYHARARVTHRSKQAFIEIDSSACAYPLRQLFHPYKGGICWLSCASGYLLRNHSAKLMHVSNPPWPDSGQGSADRTSSHAWKGHFTD